MNNLKLSILNKQTDNQDEFNSYVTDFIANLSSIDGLQFEIRSTNVEDSRGDLEIWAEIIVSAFSTGVVMGIFSIAKEFLSLYKNADVTLEYPDGSTISFKNLSRSKAESLIAEHHKKILQPVSSSSKKRK